MGWGSEFPELSETSHAAHILFARLVLHHTEAGIVGRILEIDLDG